ncbi:MAG: hypothetical protein ACRDD5_03620 [Silvania sp.]|uniref:hypothetical protein n=1 Tax=Silvania sp. TaxID=3016633 RepID=UPI003EE4435E
MFTAKKGAKKINSVETFLLHDIFLDETGVRYGGDAIHLTGGNIPNIKFECPVCQNKRFRFTSFNPTQTQPHGAVCSVCGARLTAHSCLPTLQTLRRRRWPKQVV